MTTTTDMVRLESSDPSAVPVGPTTIAGWGTAVVAFIGAIVAYTTGDHSQAQLGTIAFLSTGLVAGGITQVGRYVQAHAGVKKAAAFIEGEAKDNPFAVKQIEGEVKKEADNLASDVPGPVGTILKDIVDKDAPSVLQQFAKQLDTTPEEDAASGPGEIIPPPFHQPATPAAPPAAQE